jgi:hypothetical protein
MKNKGISILIKPSKRIVLNIDLVYFEIGLMKY